MDNSQEPEWVTHHKKRYQPERRGDVQMHDILLYNNNGEYQGCYHLPVDDNQHPYMGHDPEHEHYHGEWIGTFIIPEGSAFHGNDVTHVRSIFSPSEIEEILIRAEKHTGHKATKVIKEKI